MFEKRHFEEAAIKLDVFRLVAAEARHSELERLRKEVSSGKRIGLTRSNALLQLLGVHLAPCFELLQDQHTDRHKKDPGGGILVRTSCMQFDPEYVRARPHQFKVSPSGYLMVRIGSSGDSGKHNTNLQIIQIL